MTSSVVPHPPGSRPATSRSDPASMRTRCAWVPLSDRGRAVDGVEQPAEQLIALRRRRLRFEPRVARCAPGRRRRPGPGPSHSGVRAITAPGGVDERRGERKLGDLGQGEIHASPSGATTSVAVTLSRYLRLP